MAIYERTTPQLGLLHQHYLDDLPPAMKPFVASLAFYADVARVMILFYLSSNILRILSSVRSGVRLTSSVREYT